MPETIRTPVFSRYEILEELGSGGMGTVYKARQKFVGRLVAFKVLPPALRHDAEALQRFEREAAALGRLAHPHVVTVFDAGVEGGFPYLAMEFVEGKNLRQVLDERGRLTVEAARRLGIEMAEALDHLHRRGLVHRDVKPSNIIIDPEGRAVLTDFGIAFAATLPRITQGAMGTPEFMSPEQADGQPLDLRSDVYSLGAVLYECLAGAVPFKREGDSLTSLSKLLHQVMHETPPRLEPPAVPAWLAEAVARCMEKDPACRFQTAAALGRVLREGPASEVPPPPANGRPAKRPASVPTSKTPPPAPAETPATPEPAPPAPSEAARREPPGPAQLPPPASPTPEPAPLARTQPSAAPKPSPAKRPPPKPYRPRARTAFKVWLVVGLLVVALILFQTGAATALPLSLFDGLLLFNFFSLTPALTGALVTLFSGNTERRRVGRGIFGGLLLGMVCCWLVTAALLSVARNAGAYPAFSEDQMMLITLALGGGCAALSAVITGILLGIKLRFTTR